MECPACKGILRAIDSGDVVLDVCKKGCGGIWFDQYELAKFDEPHEPVSDAAFDVEKNPEIHVDHEEKISCPKCDGMTMMQHFFSVKHQVEIDECPNCRGYWLDFGELAAIRSQFKNREEKNLAARQYFHDVFEDQLEEVKSKDFMGMLRKVFDDVFTD